MEIFVGTVTMNTPFRTIGSVFVYSGQLIFYYGVTVNNVQINGTGSVNFNSLSGTQVSIIENLKNLKNFKKLK